jgi:hypothetical protein
MGFIRILLLIWVSLSVVSCSNKDKDMEMPDNRPITFSYDVSNLEIDSSYTGPDDKGVISNVQMIREASGMAACRSNPNILWVHNDSGNANHLHAVGTNGENFGFFWVRGAGNRDWEDICLGPGPIPGINYIYIGDIGDNQAQYNQIIINRFPEPDMAMRNENIVDDIDAEMVKSFKFIYPEGPRDAETLMIDPWTKDLYIVTKREVRSSLYVARYPYYEEKINELVKLAEFPFNRALAGDISSDGKKIVIKTDRRLYFWERNDGETVVDALAKTPRLLPYFVEPQGETFAWNVDATRYFTLSEQSDNILPRLYEYRKK